MPETPTDLRYSRDHLWVRPGDGTSLVRAGVTDFAQQSLGDVVDVRPPRPGDTIMAGEPCGDIESVKSVSDLIAPVTGTVRTRNDDLAAHRLHPDQSVGADGLGAGSGRSAPPRSRPRGLS
jgi:glycine cleavage system H protein